VSTVGASRPPHWMDIVARQKLSVSEDWEIFKWTAIGDTDDVIATGGVPRLLQSGPRKGRKTWDGKGQDVVVTRAEIKAAQAVYEAETGNCHVCGDTGQQWVGWSVADGHKYDTCRTCDGTGKAKEPA
jgi:hypothetical protein